MMQTVAGGRKTLVIVLGRERASKLYWLFLVASPAVLFCGVYSGSLHSLSLVCLAALPIGIIAGWRLGAIVSIYFYSTRIVDSGLAEVFVAVKGTMIVLGSAFIQQGVITASAAHAGAVLGILSALVLFVASFPDHDADRAGGRKTLVIVLGRERASKLYWLFLVASPAVLFCGVYSGSLHSLSLVCLAALPIGIIAGWRLGEHHSLDSVGNILKNVVLYGRITGILFLISLFASATNLV